MKKIVLGVFIGLLISSGVVCAATLINSKDVTYTPSDSNFGVSNVESALNELYTLANSYNPYLNVSFQSDVYTACSQLYYLVGAKYVDFDVTHGVWNGTYVGLYATNDDEVVTDHNKSSSSYIRENWTLLVQTNSKVENVSTQGYKYAKALGVTGNLAGGYLTVKIHN